MQCPQAALLIIGQELLSGKVRDENVAYLTSQLYALGVEVKRVLFVSDDISDIVEALQWVRSRHDYVLTTGGMGPTHDDVTIAAVAQALQRSLVHSPGLENLLERFYHVPPGPERTRLSYVPEGAELVYAEGLEFPQLIVGNVYLFPGVPSIVRQKFQALTDRFKAEPIFSEKLELHRSELEILLPLSAVVEAFTDVRIGSYPQGEDGVHLTLDGTDQERVVSALSMLKRLLDV